MVQRHKLRVADLQVQRVKQLRGQADAVSKYSVTLEANANKEGHLYGSIVATEADGIMLACRYGNCTSLMAVSSDLPPR